MKTVYEASNSLEGHMVANLLEQAKIYARVDGDFLQGAVGELQPYGIIKVSVNEDDFDRARQLLTQWEESQLTSEPSADRQKNAPIHLLITFLLGVLVGALLVA